MNGVDKTLQFLKETPNEAAVPVLVAGLDSPDRAIQEGALRAILARRRGAGQRALVDRWSKLNERQKLLIAEHPRQVAAAVRDAILSVDAEQCAKGCDVLLHIREYELTPALVTGLEQTDSPQTPIVAETLLKLAELLHQEIAGPREERRLEHPVRMRQHVLPSLQNAVDRFEKHHHSEVVEAFLMLTSHENPILRHILSEPRHPAYMVVTELLGNSTRVSIIRLVLNLLEDRVAASIAFQVVTHRGDKAFIRQLLKRISTAPSLTIKNNLRRIESIRWLQDDLTILDSLSDEEHEVVVRLAVHSGINRLRAFEVIKYIYDNGQVGGRRAASAALAEFGGADANQLALDGLDDPDPQVRANVAVQLRERGIPGAISRLIELLDSRHEIVRKAAQKSLKEFSFQQYITVFDMMEDEARCSTGNLVMRIDPNASTELGAELKSLAHTRRLRALEAAVAMDAVPHVEALVIGLLGEEDHFVRAAAARSLAHCNTSLARRALREALLDRSVSVRESAEAALRTLSDEQQIAMSSERSFIMPDDGFAAFLDEPSTDPTQ